MRRLLRLSLIFLGIQAVLCAQTWFTYELVSGSVIEVTGLEAYGYLTGTLLVSLLAIALVLYIRKRGAVAILMLSMLALVSTLVATFTGSMGIDLSVSTSIIEKVTGVASWESQLESIVLGQNASLLAKLAWICGLVVLALQTLAAGILVSSPRSQAVTKAKTGNSSKDSELDTLGLWNESEVNR